MGYNSKKDLPAPRQKIHNFFEELYGLIVHPGTKWNYSLDSNYKKINNMIHLHPWVSNKQLKSTELCVKYHWLANHVGREENLRTEAVEDQKRVHRCTVIQHLYIIPCSPVI